MALDAEDFQRMQVHLLELKNQNYALEDKCKKQKNALDEANTRTTILAQELTKSQKIIAKSKKASEVSLLIKENETLQRKLQSQEEDFRSQNQSLLEELSKLVTSNEKLELRIKNLNTTQTNSSDKPHTNTNVENKEGNKIETQIDTNLGNQNISESVQPDGTETLSLDGNSVTFRKSSISKQEDSFDGNSSFSTNNSASISYENQLEIESQEEKKLSNTAKEGNNEYQHVENVSNIVTATDNKIENITDDQGVRKLKIAYRKLEVELHTLQDKVRRKQECLVQVQAEKESQYASLSEKLESLRLANAKEVEALQEQSKRLQVQLNNGYTAFSDFKSKKSEEISTLEAKLEAANSSFLSIQSQEQSSAPQVLTNSDNQALYQQYPSSISTEKLSMSSSSQSTLAKECSDMEKKLALEKDKVSLVEDQCDILKHEKEEMQQKIENLCVETGTLSENIKTITSQKATLEEEGIKIKTQLDDVIKTSEKRKKLLDEMAIQLQTKSDEITKTKDEMKERTTALESDLKGKQLDIENLEKEVGDMATHITECENKLTTLEPENRILKADIESVREQMKNTISEASETAEEEVRCLKAENSMSIRDLNMQIEIANAQRTEFEEASQQLRQDIKDLGEDHKIGEKKQLALIKDLKRQLLAEKSQNEKLSEKMAEIVIQESVSNNHSIQNEGNQNLALASSDHMNLKIGSSNEEVDRTSNSSWSVCSNSANGAIGSISSSTSNNIDISNMANSPHYQGNLQSPIISLPQSPSSRITYIANERNHHFKRDDDYVSKEDYSILLNKIASMQEEKWAIEQKLSMLEASSSAMADDLVGKSDIILHYCMEAGKHRNVGPHSNLTTSVTSMIPSSPSPTFSKAANTTTHSSNAHGGKGVDKISAMTGKVTGFLKQQGQEISKSTLIQQLNISKGNTSLSIGPSDAGLSNLDPKQQEIKQMQRVMEETLTKNMHLQKDLENLSQEVARLSHRSNDKT